MYVKCVYIIDVFDQTRVIKVLSVTNGGRWGTWGEPSFCPPESYAAGYDMKVCIYL